MKKKRKFLQDVARFFNPHKSAYSSGVHQYEKSKESSYIPVYTGGGTARKTIGSNGKVKYV